MEKEKGPSKKVMLLIDESECSYYALMWVLNNLKESIKNLPLVIFAAQPPPPSCNYTVAAPLGFARMYFPLSATLDLINSIQEKNKKVSLGLLEKAKGICASQGVNAETIMITGDPKEAICHEVQKHEVNLLVIVDHANGTHKRAFLGSVSNYCLHNAKCQVLVVKKPA